MSTQKPTDITGVLSDNAAASPGHQCYSNAQQPAIEFFFDFISPFGWIGAEQIGAIARQFGRRINWRPFLLKVTVVDTMKITPPLQTPLKGDYLYRDIHRSLRYHGLTLADRARFGFKSLAAARAVLWMRDRSPANVEALVLALYRTHWSKGIDLSEADRVVDVLADMGCSRTDAERAISDDTYKMALRDETALAVRSGVFGSPTVIVDGEMFWGADRLPMVVAWLEQGGW